MASLQARLIGRIRVAREYPSQPVVGVGGVVVKDGRALIVKRAHDPRKGEWSIPGGHVELGETLVDATRREIKEETGLDVDVGAVIEVFDRVHRSEGRVRYHFVIVDYVCRCLGGEACAGDDAVDVAWVTGDELDGYGVNEHAARVVRRALRLAQPGEHDECLPAGGAGRRPDFEESDR